ncbi:glyoxalase [Cytobacillus depressus]|uniref:Glyoxalase n=1 Tax=Cytobacillus depressus TaxID=1602942 RepID=A0A6L3V9Q0_9BACI|nr:VOC family protein [Cytobacillus depressus]KAB2338398.1 glyoxalase [Cytobacillus depressus]
MAFRFKGIDHIQLAAPKGCEEQARLFFGDILGLEEIPKPENLQKRGGCWFLCGNQEIHIGVQEELVPAKKAHPGLVVENLAGLRENLEKRGIKIKEEPPIEGRNRLFVDDPFGNRIEFLEFLK